MYMTQIPNDFTLVIANVFLFMEISTLFVSGRWLYFEHGLTGESLI